MNQVQNSGFSGSSGKQTCYEIGVMTETQNTIDQCVEGLCSQGCGRVSVYIAALKAGQQFPEVAGLSTEEHQRVLEDLLSIMAVYDS